MQHLPTSLEIPEINRVPTRGRTGSLSKHYSSEQVKEFTYLGSMITDNGRDNREIKV
jgi:hypothetical protein